MNLILFLWQYCYVMVINPSIILFIGMAGAREIKNISPNPYPSLFLDLTQILILQHIWTYLHRNGEVI